MELSTMDIAFSPDMGGKEGLSALGYSRVHPMGSDGYPRELWQKSSTASWEVVKLAIGKTSVCKFCYDTDDGMENPTYMTVPEMKACIRRCEELAQESK